MGCYKIKNDGSISGREYKYVQWALLILNGLFICFDEFYSSISLRQMLLYCDIYPIELPSRYANKYACYDKVYIISNWPLERQYESQQLFDAETWKAFLRRVKKVITYDETGKRTEYDSLDDYFNRKEY